MADTSAYDGTTSSLDFATLRSEDEYARYFNLLSFVFTRVIGCYLTAGSAERQEAEAVCSFLQRLLYTVQVLRIKYAWSKERPHPLWVDLSESGFPNFGEVSSLETELRSRAERLRDLPAGMLLRRAVLDRLFAEQRDPVDLLQQLSERSYLELLSAEKLFLPFSAGPLRLRATEGKLRKYDFTWACYDFATNRVYLHLLQFDQDQTQAPLEQRGATWTEFLAAVQAAGGRAPDVGILALTLDEALTHAHPKALKRRCLGPLYSPLLMANARCANDAREEPMRRALERCAKDSSDFVLFFSDEVVFSSREEQRAGSQDVREVFVISRDDPECAERHASVIHHNVLLPHALLQQMRIEEQAHIPGFIRSRKYVFNESGRVHVI